MVPEVGHFALILALLLAAVQGILPIAGAARGNAVWMAVARPAAQGQFTFVAIAFGCLAYSFVNNDFSVLNVATNSNSQLPIQYRIAATWGSHEGSLLLWVLILATWSLLVARLSGGLPDAFRARVLGTLGLVGLGFLAFTMFTSSPFTRLLPSPSDGAVPPSEGAAPPPSLPGNAGSSSGEVQAARAAAGAVAVILSFPSIPARR